jgi:MoxR-like ATPase
LAFIRGRTYALPEDVSDMVLDVIRHRLVLTYEALSDGVTADIILQKIIDTIPMPAKPLQLQDENNAKS